MTLISKLWGKSTGSTATAEHAAGGHATEARSNGPLDYCRMLTQDAVEASDDELDRAWKAVRDNMALVPDGQVLLAATDPESFCDVAASAAFQATPVASLYLDRYCVTNAEFAQFVSAGGYVLDHLWPTEILSNVLQFVDSTGNPGPRDWVDGTWLAGKENHPVTGICWYEANAYAHWIGKRLPSPAEWQWAAVWAGGANAGHRRYPWGDSFDPARCNTWNSGIGKTVAVTDYYAGCTPNGIYQLIGNVWEWTSSLLECDASTTGDRILTEAPLAEIRGGAFDTYFASHATAQFRSGQTLLFRGPNLGF
ncbi:MAG: SUMF1/EgtB/PvdO family nonheme iron enzyme, partial [Planctomycetales bacterium]|nr:SUMF1/EgtB/PvdO family nonheme iron enzyme [Planctomycetales bacterium]